MPVTANVTEDQSTGDPKIDLDYDPDNGSPEDDGKIAKIEINIYDENGNLMDPSPITIEAPNKSIELPFSEYGYPSGKYAIEITAYDRHGKVLYNSYIMYYVYDAATPTPIPVPDAGSPDTGGLFQGSNIARGDLLVTGLLIFLALSLGGVIFILRRDKKSQKK